MQAYFESDNGGTGINGRKILLRVRDTEGNVDKAILEVKRLADQDKVFAFIGNLARTWTPGKGPGPAEDILADRKLIDFGPVTAAEEAGDPAKNRRAFRVLPSGRHQVQDALKYLMSRDIKPRDVAVVSLDAPQPTEERKVLERWATAQSQKLALDVTAATPQDLSARIEESAKKGPKVLFVLRPPISFDAKTVSTHSPKTLVVVTDAAEPWTRASSPGSLLTVLSVPSPAADRPGVKEYRRVHKSLSYEGLMGFVTAKVFVKGLRDAGREVSTDKVVASLERLKRWDTGVGGPITYSPKSHLGTTGAFVTEFRDGKPVRSEYAEACCDDCQPGCADECLNKCPEK